MGLKEDEEEIFVEYQKMCQKWQFAKIDILQKKNITMKVAWYESMWKDFDSSSGTG